MLRLPPPPRPDTQLFFWCSYSLCFQQHTHNHTRRYLVIHSHTPPPHAPVLASFSHFFSVLFLHPQTHTRTDTNTHTLRPALKTVQSCRGAVVCLAFLFASLFFPFFYPICNQPPERVLALGKKNYFQNFARQSALFPCFLVSFSTHTHLHPHSQYRFCTRICTTFAYFSFRAMLNP